MLEFGRVPTLKDIHVMVSGRKQFGYHFAWYGPVFIKRINYTCSEKSVEGFRMKHLFSLGNWDLSGIAEHFTFCFAIFQIFLQQIYVIL